MATINVVTKSISHKRSSRTLNIVDGVILAEAIRYAIAKARQKHRISVTYMILDMQDSNVPFDWHNRCPIFSAVSFRQIASFLLTRHRNGNATAPFVNALPFGSEEEDRLAFSSEGKRTAFATVPPIRFEIEAIVDILARFSWRFVSVIVPRDEIGEQIMKSFERAAFRKGICIGTTVRVSNVLTVYEMSMAVEKLKREREATVIVSFVDSYIIRGILQSDLRGFNFISGTNFRASRNEINFRNETARGLLLLQHDDTDDEEFKNYFMGLNLSKTRYSWFHYFWSEIFQCTIPYPLRSHLGSYKTYRKVCNVNEKLTENLVDMRYALVKPVLNAIEVLVCGLMESVTTENCSSLQNIEDVRAYMDEVMTNSSEHFDKGGCNLNSTQFTNGYIMRKYRILNFNGSDYKEVGSWYYNETIKKGVLSISVEKIACNWESYKGRSCYRPCNSDGGDFDVRTCCESCRKCSGVDEILLNNTCIKCKTFEVRAPTRTRCIPLPRIFISSNTTPMLVIQVATLIGVISTTVAAVTFAKYRNSPVVKSTGKDLSMVMMLSVTITFTTSMVFFFKPSLYICSIQNIVLGQCLGAFYIPLLLKTVRIYRIFDASKKFIRNPALVSTKSQMILCIFGLSANLLLGALFAISRPATMREKAIENYTKVVVMCDHKPMSAITFSFPCLLLLLACTYFGYKTRHFPSNFNESFRISVTMYISCLLWGVYIPLLYLFQNDSRNVFMTNLITAGLMVILGFVNLIGIFGTAFVKAVRNDKTEKPESFVSNIKAIWTENAARYKTLYRDIGTDPIDFQKEHLHHQV